MEATPETLSDGIVTNLSFLPWSISPELSSRLELKGFDQVHNTKKCLVLPSDYEAKVVKHLFDLCKPSKCSIKAIYVLDNPHSSKVFENHLLEMEKEAIEKFEISSPKWRQDPKNLAERNRVCSLFPLFSLVATTFLLILSDPTNYRYSKDG